MFSGRAFKRPPESFLEFIFWTSCYVQAPFCLQNQRQGLNTIQNIFTWTYALLYYVMFTNITWTFIKTSLTAYFFFLFMLYTAFITLLSQCLGGKKSNLAFKVQSEG